MPVSYDMDDITSRVVLAGGTWIQLGKLWMQIHVVPRNALYIPQLEVGWPELSTLLGARITFQVLSTGPC